MVKYSIKLAVAAGIKIKKFIKAVGLGKPYSMTS